LLKKSCAPGRQKEGIENQFDRVKEFFLLFQKGGAMNYLVLIFILFIAVYASL
jgi:hypothetical protein